MFQPASLKGVSPSPIDEGLRKKFFIIYILIMVLSFLPVVFFLLLYILFFWKPEFFWLFFLLLPVSLILSIYIIQIGALIISVLFLSIIKLIHPPKEGIFKRNLKDKDYVYWNLRNTIKKWPLWITATNPFPWLKNRFTLRFFGVKIGKKVMCDNCWISSEFVNIANNVIIGMNSSLISFGIEQDKFIIKRIDVEDDVLIGAKCVLLPGTTIRRGAKLATHSYTSYDSVLEENKIYLGHPAKLRKIT